MELGAALATGCGARGRFRAGGFGGRWGFFCAWEGDCVVASSVAADAFRGRLMEYLGADELVVDGQMQMCAADTDKAVCESVCQTACTPAPGPRSVLWTGGSAEVTAF